MTTKELIQKWKLNKQVLAAKIHMPHQTLKQKLLGAPAYAWTAADEQKLCAALSLLKEDIRIRAPADVIRDWQLNRRIIADKIHMHQYTFRMKVLGTYPPYRLTDLDIQHIRKALRELVRDIESTVEGRRIILDGAIIAMFASAETDEIVNRYKDSYSHVYVDKDGDIIVNHLI